MSAELALQAMAAKTCLVWRKQSKCQLNWHFKPMAAMEQQIAVMQSRMDAHDQVSDQIHVCSARHQ